VSGTPDGPRATLGHWLGYAAGRAVFALLALLPLRAARAAEIGRAHV